MEYTVVHDEQVDRFEVVEFDRIAYLQYDEAAGIMDILHIYVPTALENKGIASSLVKAALSYAEEKHLFIKPTCPFARSFFARHVEYKGLLV